MDRSVVYADLSLSRGRGPESSSPPSLPQDVCQGPRWHQLALKLGCAGIILLVLSVIGLSVLVISLTQTSPIEKNSVDVQENRNYTTETPGPLQCSIHWSQLQDKCIFFSGSSNTWKDSLADCSQRESSLLLIQDQEELRHIHDLIKTEGILYWFGLNFTLSEKNWKWINGSFLDHDILQIFGENKENSCAAISKTKVFSSNCDSENKWICEKKLKPVRNKICPNS
ncbi:killer cell lectin-like receptor subfamily B member 1 isoform X1 [Sciurus carolinensis]|uniref:killer cell lectin-like receptor subfamily B member 1 isoform X1 n=1 Tax=Sciurus carolinensis TaxID=30640 RepID=UPI001FB3A0F6|nr:killer cell lectin-like receptor subfamily B member 1 isoform X1 [Sciurus carolinensis]